MPPLHADAPVKIFVVIALVLAAIGGLFGLYHFGQSQRTSSLSTPAGAVRSFYECLDGSHPVETVRCVVDSPEQQALAAQLASLVAGGLGMDDLTMLPRLDDSDLDRADVVMEEDGVVYLTMPADENVDPVKDVERPERIVLRSDGSDWRVDLLATTGMSESDAIAFVERMQTPAPDEAAAVTP